MSAGASPHGRPHWRSLQRSARPPSWFQGVRFATREEWSWGTRGRGREMKAENGEGRRKWGSAGNSALFIGVDAPGNIDVSF